MNNCKHRNNTSQKWAGNVADCFVVECHNPTALVELKTFHDENGAVVHGVRRPCDEHFNLIPNADYLHVRSRYCNPTFCKYYTKEENK